MKSQKIILSLLFLSLLTLPLICGAQPANGGTAITNTISTVVSTCAGIAAAVCGLMILYGGFVMLVSGGSPEKVSSGRQIILWAVIGLVICVLAWSLAGWFNSMIKTA